MTLNVFGYDIVDLLHEGSRSTIYRAKRGATPVIVKLVNPALPQGRSARLLKREAELLRSLEDLDGVVRLHELAQDGDRWGLVIEDFGGASLRQLGLAGVLSSARVVSIGLAIVDILARLHGRHVLHRDVAPANIVLNPESEVLKLVDFASASLLPQHVADVGLLEGSLAYISPEQTGRVNRPVDYRSDYYSLGVTLYELLTGILPFTTDDPLELVHAHLARRPPYPTEFNPEIPRPLSNIVLKLLSKDADDRYQSAAVLRRDLQRCQAHITSGVTTFDFPLGVGDRPERFRLPQRLYGRDAQIQRLATALARARQRKATLVTLTGAPGIGKTALVNEFLLPVGAQGAYYALGKFEQYGVGGPYAAIGQALESLVQQLLAENPKRFGELRKLTRDGLQRPEVLTTLCPSLALILEPRPPVSILPGMEARVRLEHAIGSLLRLIATAERPVCLLFDDAQWSRADSVAVLKDIVRSARDEPLVFIMAFRDQEVQADHPLRTMVSELKEERVPVEHVELTPLAEQDLGALIQDALGIGSDVASPLAEVVFMRTAGNPFFSRAFLMSLYSAGVLEWTSEGCHFDIDAVRREGVTDNVVEHLIGVIARLPAATQEVLQAAACLGSRFDVRILNAVAGSSCGCHLWPALVCQLVLPLDRVDSPDELGAADARISCRFAHDRVQQALVSMIDEASQARLRLKVGRVMLSMTKDGQRGPWLFDIVNQLNRALALMGDVDERIALSKLDLEAARAALAQGASADSLQLARAGVTALGEGCWAQHYDLTMDLHVVATEAAFAARNQREFELLSRESLAHARSASDVLKVRRLEGRWVHQTHSRSGDAIRTYLDTLGFLGIHLPVSPTSQEIGEELRQAAEALRGKEIGDLLALPTCADTRAQEAMELLSKLIFFTYATTNDLFAIAICRLVRLSLQHGNAPESANGYTFYGRLLCRDHDIERAYRFGQLALELSHRTADAALLSQTYLYVHYELMHWKTPLSELTAAFEKAYQYGLKTGSPFNASFSATTLFICKFWAGDELGGLLREMDQAREVIAPLRLAVTWHDILRQATHNLRSCTPFPTILKGPIYDEKERLPEHQAKNESSTLFNYNVVKTFLCYLFGDHRGALAAIEHNRALLPTFATAFWAIPLTYLHALCCLAGCEDAASAERAAMLEWATKDCEKLQAWRRHNPTSIDHKIRTIEAERARICGETTNAGRLFADAVALARANGTLFEQGIAGELASRFSTDISDTAAAQIYLRGAHRAYIHWGATTKVMVLEREHPHVLPRTIASPPEATTIDHNIFDRVDLLTILNASHLLSSEIRSKTLLPRLMSLLIETGGAQVGYLIRRRENDWLVDAGRGGESEMATLRKSVPVLEFATSPEGGLALSIVNYVARTGEPVLLDDAYVDPRFSKDPHIAAYRTGSVHCFPLKRGRETIAIVYLENSLTRGAFTANKIKLLEMLSAHAVTSLENATIYDDLEREVQAQTKELRNKNAELADVLARLVEMQRVLVSQEKLAALGVVTAGIAHEIKNPLNLVLNLATETVKQAKALGGCLNPELSRFQPQLREEMETCLTYVYANASKITEHSNRISEIVNRMAMQARGRPIRRETADLNAVLEQSLGLASHLQERGVGQVEIIRNYDTALGFAEVAVQDVSGVFVNLINNACDATKLEARKKGPDYVRRLMLSTKEVGGQVEVRVCDNGVGIPEEIRERIFDPYFTTKPGEGLGLGLWFSHNIVRDHEGELRVESTPGIGTEFVVLLPKRRRGSVDGSR